VLRGLNQPFQVEELELAEPGPGELEILYVASGVCHSDYHVVKGDLVHPLPVVLGHEGAGVVERVGAGVKEFKVGDHVLTSYQPTCGHCSFCAIGRPNLCELRDRPRHVMWDGTSRMRSGGEPINHYLQLSTYAERAIVPEECLVGVRKDAPLDVVCVVSCAVTAGAGAVMNRAKVVPGSSVAVFGCGGVGLNAIQAAAFVGAGRVIAVDIQDQKLEWATDFGATHLINSANEDPVARIQAICGRGGADYAIEVVGAPSSMTQAFESVHRGGTVVILGVPPSGTRIPIDPWKLLEERVLTGSSFGGSRQKVDLPMFVDLFMSGRWKMRELISRRIGLDELNSAYESMLKGEVRRSVVVYS